MSTQYLIVILTFSLACVSELICNFYKDIKVLGNFDLAIMCKCKVD